MWEGHMPSLPNEVTREITAQSNHEIFDVKDSKNTCQCLIKYLANNNDFQRFKNIYNIDENSFDLESHEDYL